MEYELQVQEIMVLVRLKDIKNIHLSVHPPNGDVTLSAPWETQKEKIRVYLLSKLGWIRKQREKFSRQARESGYLYLTRESYYLFGERFLLKVNEINVSQRKAAVEKKQKTLELNVPIGSKRDFKEKLLKTFCRSELKEYLQERIGYWAGQMDLEEPSFGIRKMKTKWGSCNRVKNNLLFNAELAKKPKPCIDYVVVHEMVHLRVRHHNQDFILLMDRYLANWRLRKKELNDLPVGTEPELP